MATTNLFVELLVIGVGAACWVFLLILQARFTDADWYPVATTWGTAGCLILALTSWWSWRILCITEYMKIREHAEFLSSRSTATEVKLAA